MAPPHAHHHDGPGGHAHGGPAHGAPGGPAHGAPAEARARRLWLALALIAGFMALEVVVGILANSLALLSDAGHMLTDAVALGLSIFALRLATRPARGAMTYGLRRVEALSAQANGVTLLVLACLVVYGAVERLVTPRDVAPWPVIAVALAGMAVNSAATLSLSGAGRENLAVEGAFRHILTDLYAFIGTAVAGVVILLTGFDRADPIASLVVAGLMLHSAYWLLRASGRVFLEAAPERLDPEIIGRALVSQPGVVEVHDLHVWEVGSGFPSLSAHVLVARDADCHAIRRVLERVLQERFALEHTTLQVDHEGGGLLTIEPSP
jgi:cobalt-zinc-cadmium efflux system protein